MYARRFYRTIGCACILLLASSAGFSAAAPQVTIRFAAALSPATTHVRAMSRWKEVVEKRTDGRVSVGVFHSGQLGATGELLQQVRAGTVTMSLASTGFMTAFVPKLGVFNFPFVFASREAAWRTFDGPIGREMWARTEAAGFKNLGCEEIGWRVTLNNKRPLGRPDDFRGLKIRVQPIKVHLETFKLLGANPVAMDFAELYTAMQQGVIDAVEGSASVFLDLRFNEVAKFASETPFFFEVLCRWMNKDFWDRLPSDLQTVLMETSVEAAVWQRDLMDKENEAALGTLAAKGVKRNKFSPESVEAFRRITAPLYDTFADEFGRDLITRVVRAGQAR